ncbi:hypothetical protein ACGFIV_23160 [Sphaerisporangium sp. NPDC049003]|uniref:hypothetical protein n=1 Tax=Sphaerisporangium sp. NPDC049003 TaxID=3364517 RepID=UPI00371495EA
MHRETAKREAWIVLGGIHLLNQTAPRQPDDPIVLVQVPPQEVSTSPTTTVVVHWDALGPCPVRPLTASGDALAPGREIDGSALFPDAIAGPDLMAMTGPTSAPGLVPLCYLAQHAAATTSSPRSASTPRTPASSAPPPCRLATDRWRPCAG